MFTNSIVKTYNFFFNYPTPGNLTNVWNFGVLGFLFLSIQLVSGMILTLYYIPHEYFSYKFVENLMRDSFYGFYWRYIHSNGASLFFFCIYLHFFRSLYYFSYMKPKLVVWNSGVAILLLMIIAAFTGYVLPWGQMSFWAATVITNLVTVVPIFGNDIVITLWGSYGVSNITLNRFYSAHFFIPFAIFFIVCLHFYFLHKIGSSNNLFIENKGDKVGFHPFYTLKDFYVVLITFLFYISIIAFFPNHLAHSDNYIEADPLVTPMHIVPEWYFLTFYAILRAVPHKLTGIIFMFSSIAILFIFPFFIKYYYEASVWCVRKFDLFQPKNLLVYLKISKRFNPFVQSILFWIFFANFIGLSYIGMMPVENPYENLGLLLTINYFGFFFCSLYIHSFHYWMQYLEQLDKEFHILNFFKKFSLIFKNLYFNLKNDLEDISLSKIFNLEEMNEFIKEFISKKESKEYSGYLNNSPKSKNKIFISKISFC